MSNYTKATNFATKDSLPSGNPAKIVKGTEINDEFDAIEVALNSKADINSPIFTGDPRAPTPTAGDNDTSLATTAFVTTALNNLSVCSSQIGDNCVTADELNVSGDGTSGQYLSSNGDGSFSWSTLSGRIQAPATTAPTTRDSGSALQEGDLYYNTADDALYSYDGSSWNIVGEFDPAAGATGTLIPPVGAMFFGRINIVIPSINGSSELSAGYGDTWAVDSGIGEYIKHQYNFRYESGQLQDTEYVIETGTWRNLGIWHTVDANGGGGDNRFGMLQRIA